MSAPRDLAAVEAHIQKQMFGATNREIALALLAALRAHRAVLQRLRDWAATEAPGWTHMIDAVLAQVSDGEAAP